MNGQDRWALLTELQLDSLARWTAERLRNCDPYLVWAEASTRRSKAGRTTIDTAVLIELRQGVDWLAFLRRINARHCCLVPSGVEQSDARFQPAFASRHGLRRLLSELHRGDVVRFSLQESRGVLSDALLQTLSQLFEQSARSAVGPRAAEAAPVAAGTCQAYVAIIDDGLPIARVQSLGQPRAQNAPLWDQGWQERRVKAQTGSIGKWPACGDPYWNSPWDEQALRGFLYGRRLKPLPTLYTADRHGGDGYASRRYFAPAPRETHGAAVLGLMAPWLAASQGAAAWPTHIAGLAMVQLPTSTVDDTSGGSLAMRVLDGLRFILWQEQSTRAEPSATRPVVVNLSYGVHAGPHDGTSMIECALHEALKLNTHLHLVLAAGNAHRAGCHAHRWLGARGSANAIAQITLRVLPDNARDSFVELWFPTTADVVLGIRPPASAREYRIARGEARLHADVVDATPQVVHFGAVYAEAVAQGRGKAMILLVIGSTRPRRGEPVDADAQDDVSAAWNMRGLNQRPRREVLAPSGVWTLTLYNAGRTPTTVDAFVERGDASPQLVGGSRQATFPDSCDEALRQYNATPEGTLNGIATVVHERAHVVGAMRADGRLSDYSAARMSRASPGVAIPRAVVQADWSQNVSGLKTTGFVEGAVARINGTSAAAAVYARELARSLAGAGESTAALPPAPPPEIDCAAERQPSADPALRGDGQRVMVPFEVFEVDSLRRAGA